MSKKALAVKRRRIRTFRTEKKKYLDSEIPVFPSTIVLTYRSYLNDSNPNNSIIPQLRRSLRAMSICRDCRSVSQCADICTTAASFSSRLPLQYEFLFFFLYSTLFFFSHILQLFFSLLQTQPVSSSYLIVRFVYLTTRAIEN